jgi:hypothetical protein
MRGPDIITGTLGVGRSVKSRSRVAWMKVRPWTRGLRMARAGAPGPFVAWRQSLK